MQRDLKHVPAVEPAAAGIALALGECEMLCWLVVKSAMSNNIGLMAAPVANVVGGYLWLKSRER
jgi:L-serine deaminase